MSRASTKPDLLKSANDQFDKLWKLIDSMTDGQELQTLVHTAFQQRQAIMIGL